MKSGRPGMPAKAGEFLEDHVREHHPRGVHLARAQRRHLPVEHGDGLEVLVEHVAHPGVAPDEHRLRGRDVLGPVRLQPLERLLDERGPADVGRPRTGTRTAASSGCAATRLARRRRLERPGTRKYSRPEGLRAAWPARRRCCPAVHAVTQPVSRRTSCRRRCRASRRAGRHRTHSPSRRTACRARCPSAPATAPAAPARRSSRRPTGSRRTGGPSGTTRTPARPRWWALRAPPTSLRAVRRRSPSVRSG